MESALFSDKQKIFCTDRILAELLDTCVMMLSTSRGGPVKSSGKGLTIAQRSGRCENCEGNSIMSDDSDPYRIIAQGVEPHQLILDRASGFIWRMLHQFSPDVATVLAQPNFQHT